MRNPESRQQIIDDLQDAVVEFDQDLVCRAAQRALMEGVDARDAVMNGLAGGIERASELCTRGEYFLPEMTMCADAFYAGLKVLGPHVKQSAQRPTGSSVVIGTVEGDSHDIGKNLVKLMLEAAGFVVWDLGTDVSPERFLKESIREQADLVCVSVSLATSLSSLPRLIDTLRVGNPKVRIVVGGWVVTEEQASKWGVDGYASDAWNISQVAMHLVD